MSNEIKKDCLCEECKSCKATTIINSKYVCNSCFKFLRGKDNSISKQKHYEEKDLIPFDVMRFLSEYVDGINKIIPSNVLSDKIRDELKDFYWKFIEKIRNYYLGKKERMSIMFL